MAYQEDPFKATRQVLSLIGLAPDEMNAYFNMTGRGPIMVGELALVANVSEERATQIAKNLVEKGLVREIPGKTPFYSALPPYVALLTQIKQFKDSIKNMQQSTPEALQLRFQSMESQSTDLQKFEEYLTFVREMKTTLPAQIKSDFQQFEKELESVKRFQEIQKYILNLKEIVPNEIGKEFGIFSAKIEDVKTQISESFEKTFRVGAMKNMAEKIVSKVISEQFLDMAKNFRDRFIKSIQDMLDQVVGQLGSLSDTAGDISTDLGTTFSDIQEGLQGTLGDLETRISDVYQDIQKGLEDLKNTFQKQVFESLSDDIIVNIVKQFEMAEETMNEFWEQSKKASQQTFKDVWFVRSFEGMKAQILDSISRVKMRLYIIAPKLEDIDMVALSKVRKHVNIRISTNFNPNAPSDQAKLTQIAQIPNMSIRLYERENLWAINKDFEEVVVCVVSKDMHTNTMEIAGMGSVLDEHIKLFAAVLEDIWIQSKKQGTIGIPSY